MASGGRAPPPSECSCPPPSPQPAGPGPLSAPGWVPSQTRAWAPAHRRASRVEVGEVRPVATPRHAMHARQRGAASLDGPERGGRGGAPAAGGDAAAAGWSRGAPCLPPASRLQRPPPQLRPLPCWEASRGTAPPWGQAWACRRRRGESCLGGTPAVHGSRPVGRRHRGGSCSHSHRSS